MDEDKPEHPQPHNSGEDADNSLVSKLARAYSSLPPEQREASALRDGGEFIANPEAEDRFQKLLQELEVLETYTGHRDHKPDPRVVAQLEKKIERLQAQGDEPLEVAAPMEATPVGAVSSLVEGGIRCGKCGHSNSAFTRFCGMCGVELSKSEGSDGAGPSSVAATAASRRQPEAPAFSTERGAEGRSARGSEIGLLVLLVAGLALIVYQQWPLWPQQLFHNNWITRTPNSPPAPTAAVSTAPAPAERSAKPPTSVKAPQQVSSTPSPKAVQNPPPEPAPPITIRRPLPGPVPLTSSLPQIDAPSSTQSEPEAREPPPQRIRLAPAVAQGGLIFSPDPEYPQVARMARVQGSVVLHAIIGNDGTVQQLQVVSGNPFLAGPAMNAVKNWRYRPYLVDGQAVEVETTVTVHFKSED